MLSNRKQVDDLKQKVGNLRWMLDLAERQCLAAEHKIKQLEAEVAHLEGRLSTAVTKEIVLLEQLIEKDDLIIKLTEGEENEQ